jgi:hypothetical protein
MEEVNSVEKTEYKYDVAFSFAGEDRQYVDRVANILKKESVKVFYDFFETIELWGKDLSVQLNYVYKKASRYFIPFISKHYKEKIWTKYELRSALQRVMTQSEGYLLPVRFDDTEIEGINANIAYIDLRNHDEESFADIILAKLKKGRDIHIVDINEKNTTGGNQNSKKTKGVNVVFGNHAGNLNTERVISIVQDLNKKIYTMIDESYKLRLVQMGSPECIELINQTNDSIDSFEKYLNENRLLIDAEIVSCAEKIRDKIQKYVRNSNTLFPIGSERWAEAAERSTNEGATLFTSDIPSLRRQLEERFRNIYMNM